MNPARPTIVIGSADNGPTPEPGAGARRQYERLAAKAAAVAEFHANIPPAMDSRQVIRAKLRSNRPGRGVYG